ncbi:hypothetical protein Afe04nite_04530 [Asanoa ferruginea]|nr:hypothetical protein Afe04nite_04530 [Asanoa ferruginea]
MRTAGRGQVTGLGDDRRRLVVPALRERDVGQPDQIGGDAGRHPGLAPQPRRLLQQMSRGVEPAAGVLGDAEVPQHVGQHQPVAGRLDELARPLERRHGGGVVVPDELVEDADPEQRLALAASVAERPEQLRRPFEERQLMWIFPLGLQETPVHHPATGQRQRRFDAVEFALGDGQAAVVSREGHLLVEQFGPLDRIVHVRQTPVRSVRA